MTFGGAELRESNKAVRKLPRASVKAVLESSGDTGRSEGPVIDKPSVNRLVSLGGANSAVLRQPDNTAVGMTTQERRVERPLDHLHALHAIVDGVQENRPDRAEKEASKQCESEI